MYEAPICSVCNLKASLYPDVTEEIIWLCPNHQVVKRQCPHPCGETLVKDDDTLSWRCPKCNPKYGKTSSDQKTAAAKKKTLTGYGGEYWNDNYPYAQPSAMEKEGKTATNSVGKRNTPCRYGDECQTKNCPYAHSFGKEKEGKTSAQKNHVDNGITACRYAGDCRTKNCPYAHPSIKEKITCKHGPSCWTPTCHYDHPWRAKK